MKARISGFRKAIEEGVYNRVYLDGVKNETFCTRQTLLLPKTHKNKVWLIKKVQGSFIEAAI